MNRAVGPTQMQSAWCALLQDIELVPQYQDFRFQPPPRLENRTARRRKGRQLQSYDDHALIRCCPRVKWTKFSEATRPVCHFGGVLKGFARAEGRCWRIRLKLSFKS